MLDAEVREAILAVRDRAAAQGMVATFSLHREHSHLMRIGNNSVSLNTTEALTRLDIQVTEGRRQGSHHVLGQVMNQSQVEEALAIAAAKARVAMDKDYQPPPDVVEEPVEEAGQYDPALATLDPAVKAEAYRQVMAEVGERYNYSGSWSSGVTEQYLVTTANRHEAWHIGTDQHFTVVLKHPEKRWELRHTQTGWRAEDFDASRTVDYFRQLLPVFEGQDGFHVPPGTHTVLFGPQAIAGIVGMAAFSGLGGRGWEEKLGWTSNFRPGDQILGESVTLVDDPENELTFGFGFDMSGHRRRHFPLVEDGRLVQLMYDANTAAKYGRQATGHGLGSLSLVLATGGGPADPLAAVADLGRVLYIPALHYMHLPNRSQGIFTGSSRFSAVLVEDGQVVRPIFSSRITDTFQRVLAQVRQLAPQAVSVNQSSTYGRRSPVATAVPAYMVVGEVKITDCADSF